jgi:hypothetical protein
LRYVDAVENHDQRSRGDRFGKFDFYLRPFADTSAFPAGAMMTKGSAAFFAVFLGASRASAEAKQRTTENMINDKNPIFNISPPYDLSGKTNFLPSKKANTQEQF